MPTTFQHSMTPSEFLWRMIAMSTRYPFRVTSFYRDKDSNLAVGGHPHSRHQFWLAMDVILRNQDDKAGFITDAKRLGLVIVDEPDHIHIQAP